jgi:hypothetical protein
LRKTWTGEERSPCQKPAPFKKEPEVEANGDLGYITNCPINAADFQFP